MHMVCREALNKLHSSLCACVQWTVRDFSKASERLYSDNFEVANNYWCGWDGLRGAIAHACGACDVRRVVGSPSWEMARHRNPVIGILS
eukprot:355789-Chlamydomonas_euryale.AAC.6